MKTHLYAFGLALILIPGCSHWKISKYRRSDTQYAWLLSAPKRNFNIFHFNSGDQVLRFISVGDTSLPALVLVHGSPGSIETFDPYLLDTGITNHVRLIAMDRPGYGYSNFGHPDTSILSQAKVILKCLKQDLHLSRYSILGYSYGGPVAAVISSLDTGGVQKLFLVSASLAPGKEKIYRVSHLIKKPALGLLFPRIIRTANTEKLSHLTALREVRFMYQTIRCDVFILHGLNDKLIYPANATYMQQSLVAADTVSLYTERGGHRAILKDDKNYLQNLIISNIIAGN